MSLDLATLQRVADLHIVWTDRPVRTETFFVIHPCIVMIGARGFTSTTLQRRKLDTMNIHVAALHDIWPDLASHIALTAMVLDENGIATKWDYDVIQNLVVTQFGFMCQDCITNIYNTAPSAFFLYQAGDA